MSLATARYGKDLVRVFRVVRCDTGVHEVAEYEACAMVEGQIAASYTEADNSVVVATDSMKNIIYYLAKTSQHVLSPELFATHIGAFLLDRYPHLTKAFITLQRFRWTRIVVGSHAIARDGKTKVADSNPNREGHNFSFKRDGEEKDVVEVEVRKVDGGKGTLQVDVVGGMKDLLVLKSSGSAFNGFVRDDFTTLPEVDDRIFSTSVDMSYTFPTYTLEHGLLDIGGMESARGFAKAAELARGITLDLFATHNSASVQATLFKMGQALIAEHEHISSVSYVLPNKHYIPVDMKYLGIENTKEEAAEVFMPVSAPSGRITATVSR